ncbi:MULTISPECIES: TonB-dependent siderophore receptor [unclassified Pseudomonas]|uniref:TonB-dependent siderophore receptor n=1 Tax=unclassified Pseudomonas TaxID=196821 RepID=UPI0008764B2C|nr:MULTISPECIES: TonB-dependent siderophore receptor [unclassified Pseudomonas]SCZ32147.1 iron complex outermembrane recepter protein [Pseudomonas sp. NFACC44-2]SDA50205.1 iron complex outermembrane recepter protein [Pseudomonas sp. NFACC51]SEJ38437.1 iron complex outermembrane recepter protein [Pseudomonas sp. NFACC07-1]SFH59153.1 iron complex outermembrane recepter protein [Pseudomonas sp. NFACC54]SFT11745.1 iron complex outermembrane recepter protein [Pseudomonas sp. NFACC48-1]
MRRILVSLCVLQAYSVSTWAEQPVPAKPASLELQATDIVGSADYESAQGPVKGYHATRSASATRTDTAIHETPQSISVVSRDVVEDLGATRLQDALDYAGGVGRGNNFGGQGLTTFTVRGFTTGEFYRNGFPINRGYPNMPDANTIERLEVLRGPATMLYGRGDPGGTFNVVSKQPLAERTVTLGSQVSDQGMRRGTLDASGPLDEEGRLAYRLNVIGEGGDTFRDHVETERYGVAPVVSWQVNDTTRLTFEGDFMRNNAPLDRGLTHYAGQRGTASRDTFFGEKDVGKLHNDNNMLQVRFEHMLNDDWTLAGGTQWLDGTLQGNAIEGNGIAADGRTLGRNFNYRKLEWTDRDTQLNLTGHFSTGGFEHTLLTGIEYEDYDYQSIIQRSSGVVGAYPIDIFDPVYGQPRPALTRKPTDDQENLKTFGVFVQDQVALTERLKLLAGARFERFEHKYENFATANGDWDASHNAVTPRLGVIYDLTDTVAVYANTARSFKPNTGRNAQGGGFKPEEGKSYEMGIKWEALDRQVSVDAAVYQIEKRNVLTSDPQDSTLNVAAGEVRSRGFDLNVAGNLTPEWRVIGGYAYVDAEVVKDNTFEKGSRLLNVPRNSFSLLNVYEFQDGGLKGLGLGLGARYVDERAGKMGVNPFSMDSYTVVDLLGYYKVNERIRLNLDLKNLFDADYEEGAFGGVYAYPGAPRTVQAGISYTL